MLQAASDPFEADSQRLNASTMVVADFDSHDGVALFTEVLRSMVGLHILMSRR